jgi:hypothetical protein
VFLRSAFAVSFLAHAAVAALVGIVVVLLAGAAPRNPNSLLAWMLVGMTLAQLPVALLIVVRAGALRSGPGARRAALSSAILTGVMLASTAWFLALALATGQGGTPLFVLLLVTLTAYSVGFLLMGRLGRVAATELIEPPTP